MTIPLDVTRCLGEGSSGFICIMRQQCRRYLDRERCESDRPLIYAGHLCRDGRFVDRIAAEKAE
jgi:hypothetical protein